MDLEIIVIIGGIYNLGFLIFHLLFWKIFNWKRELRLLNTIDKSTIQVLNLSLTFVFLILAYISIFHSNDLITTSLGKALLLAEKDSWREQRRSLAPCILLLLLLLLLLIYILIYTLFIK